MCNQITTTRPETLTVNALLIVMMLVRTACISSLLSNQSSYQGVLFQLMDRNLWLDDEDGGTRAPDVS
jgi:hypothetical protein